MLLATMIEDVARRHPDRVAVADADRSLNYQQLCAARDAVGAQLLASGLVPGDRVAVLSHNCVEQVVVYHAAFRAGLIVVPVNTRLAGAEVTYLLEHSEASALVVHAELAPTLPADRFGIGVDRVWSIASESDGLRVFDSDGPDEPAWPDLAPDAPAAILYTSGTTSKPKGVTHSHTSLFATAANQAWTQEFGADDVHLVTLSIAHIAGFAGQVLTAAYAGGTAILLGAPTPEEILEAIARFQPTYLQMTPALLSSLLEIVDSPASLASVRCCLVGGDKVPAATSEALAALVGFGVTEVCGMTESFSYCMNPPFGEHRPGSIGLPTHGTRVRIARADGSEAAPHEIGELQIQAAANMVGYWEEPEKTAEVLVDSWVRSGDMGRTDEDGWFYFEARRNDMIIHVDENVSPLEVEDALMRHPSVAEVAVVGLADLSVGERVVAAVVLHPGTSATPDELVGFAGTLLAAYETPDQVVILEALPHNATGKVDRRAVKAQLSATEQT